MLEWPEQLTEEDLEKHRIWILWLEALGIMIIFSIVGAYWERAKLRFKTKSIGPVEAFFEAFDEWHDPQHVLDEGKDGKVSDDDDNNNGKKKRRSKRESFEMEYLSELLSLLIFAMQFASGWLISAAVKATLTKTYEKVYDPDTVLPDEGVSGDVVWTMWLAFGIALIASTLIMTYLSKVVTAARKGKHEIFKKWEQELKERDDEIDQELGVKDNGRTNNATDDREEEDESVGLSGDKDKTEVEMQ